MMHDLRNHDEQEADTLPSVDEVFDSPAVLRPASAAQDAPAPGTKVAGPADSSRNNKSTLKAPGGKDASRQKDGG